MAAKPRPGRKEPAAYRLADATLDGTLEAWPDEAAPGPRTPVEAVRMVLISTPGQAHRLGWRFSDVGRASRIASAFRWASPARLLPTATGSFDARAYFDPAERRWRIAARYVPPEGPAPDEPAAASPAPDSPAPDSR